MTWSGSRWSNGKSPINSRRPPTSYSHQTILSVHYSANAFCLRLYIQNFYIFSTDVPTDLFSESIHKLSSSQFAENHQVKLLRFFSTPNDYLYSKYRERVWTYSRHVRTCGEHVRTCWEYVPRMFCPKSVVTTCNFVYSCYLNLSFKRDFIIIFNESMVNQQLTSVLNHCFYQQNALTIPFRPRPSAMTHSVTRVANDQ